MVDPKINFGFYFKSLRICFKFLIFHKKALKSHRL
nr:MAG TPA: hypothetical protein [Caudoviricetes sp.]